MNTFSVRRRNKNQWVQICGYLWRTEYQGRALLWTLGMSAGTPATTGQAIYALGSHGAAADPRGH